MKITGNQFLGILKDYFSGGHTTSADIFWYLLLPGIIFTVILLIYTLWPGGDNGNNFRSGDEDEEDLHEEKESDFVLIDSIRLQKGLESFDRDFLVNICSENKADVVKVMLDKSALESLENKLWDKAVFQGLEPEKQRSVQYLRKLKKRLFS